jgi:hypothetical protein
MIIKKTRVTAVLRERGLNMRADWVDRELPELIDSYLHGGLLSTLNVDLADLAEPADAPSR